MKKSLFSIGLIGAVVLVAHAVAFSATLGFEFTISIGNPDQPTLRLKNTSSDGVQLVSFLMTIGDAAYNFDWITDAYPETDSGGDLSSTLIIGDPQAQNNIGTDLFEFLFTGFDPNDKVRFYPEIDQDGTNSGEDCRTIFFNNSDAPNAILRGLFKYGPQLFPLSYTLPDGASDSSFYEFTASKDVATPIPGAVWLLGSGLAGLLIVRTKRNSSS